MSNGLFSAGCSMTKEFRPCAPSVIWAEDLFHSDAWKTHKTLLTLLVFSYSELHAVEHLTAAFRQKGWPLPFQ